MKTASADSTNWLIALSVISRIICAVNNGIIMNLYALHIHLHHHHCNHKGCGAMMCVKV